MKASICFEWALGTTKDAYSLTRVASTDANGNWNASAAQLCEWMWFEVCMCACETHEE